MKLRIYCIIILLFSSIICFAQPEKVASDLASIIEKHQVVGLSVALVKQDKIIYTQSFGLKNIERKTPLSDQDIFRIASISKSFSATSIMQLVEAKKISLTDDFSKLVGFTVRNPKYPSAVITLKMILSHTSSINDSQGYFNLDAINPAKNKYWEKCYNDYKPGTGYEYCNLNYNMVGAVIEKVSGTRFDSYVKQHVLNPLSLYGGFCVDSLDQNRLTSLYAYDSALKTFTESPAAYALRREEIQNYTMGYTTPIFSPTGGMKISAKDLATYMIMHMNGGEYNNTRIISRKSSKIMQTKISKEVGYGLAISNLEDLIPGKLMTGHTGSAYGLYSAMFFNKKEKYGFVVITNGCNPTYTNGINDVLRETINSLYANLIETK
jgi:CubicO group peptidase (beta-lactamase class C family)